FCFFFQAEDGIRDRNVTGVQTCALPICFSVTKRSSAMEGRFCGLPSSSQRAAHFSSSASLTALFREPITMACRAFSHSETSAVRSEERRVGKEWRDRWLLDRLREEMRTG